MMRWWVGAVAAMGLAQAANAGELDLEILRGAELDDSPPPRIEVTSPSPNIARTSPLAIWSGFYAGGHIGAGWGLTNFSEPFVGGSVYGGKVPTRGFLAGGQFGYNWQSENLVLGFEADVSGMDSDGSNTCIAFSGQYVSATCRARPDIAVDLTGRLGWAYGHSNHSLVYAKGGFAFVHNRIDITTNAASGFGLAPLTTSYGFMKAGWIAGVGVEHMIAPAWTVKVEYDYTGIGQQGFATPPGLFQPTAGVNSYILGPSATTRVGQGFQQVKLGLNYNFGMDPRARWDAPSSAIPLRSHESLLPAGWEIETGARYWYSGGSFQKDLGSTTNPALATTLNSRLTYNTTANSAEFFGRIETPIGIFVKGNIGAGALAGGRLNDEDWAIFNGTVPYSNTVSDPVKGHINYATLDVGYDFFRGPGYKLGVFGGYNYYTDNKSAYGCSQAANLNSDCVTPIPNNVLVITENDIWKSYRAGFNGEVMVTDRVKLGTDVAYLPYVTFNGTDDHVLRGLISSERGTGRGWQIESVLSYLITDRLSVGVGGRYWAMWTNKNATADFNGAACPCQTQPAKAERYGVFLQAAYNFGG